MNENMDDAVKILREGIPCARDLDDTPLRRVAEAVYNKMNEYNGYRNAETYSMDLWLSSDRDKYNLIRDEIIPECRSQAPTSKQVREGIWTPERYVQFCTADRIEEMVKRQEPELEGVWQAYITSSLAKVDWDDIAEGFIKH